MRDHKGIIIRFAIIIFVALSAVGAWLVFRRDDDTHSTQISEPTAELVSDSAEQAERRSEDQAELEPEAEETKYERVQFSLYDPSFRLSAAIPRGWKVESVPSIQSLNIYDPAADDTPLSSSQIFLRQFTASRFLTLSTVVIHSREETKLHGHEAVRYEIEKKVAVAPFPHQPQWRNERHRLIDVRFSEKSPSVFYVIAFRPSLAQDVEKAFLDELVFYNDEKSFIAPISRASERITKKPFGIRVTPDDSPVQPERFSGYHTGVDFEVESDESQDDVAVHSICGGLIKDVRFVNGYGGVIVQECELGTPVSVTYGHLKLSRITLKKGEYIAPGEKIAILGKGGTDETDGERTHLHLGIYRSSRSDLRGYVDSKKALADWIDPCSIGLICGD